MTAPVGSKLTGHSGNDELRTPGYIYDWLHRRFWFNYDPASSAGNHKTAHYSTISGTFDCADSSHGHESANPYGEYSFEDGLAHSWADHRVFVNPPYSRGLLGAFIEKAIIEKDAAECIAMLVKVDTSTAWWRLLEANSHVEYLRRVRYLDTDGEPLPAATFASAIAILRPSEPKPW